MQYSVSKDNSQKCILCHSSLLDEFEVQMPPQKVYFKCNECNFIFLDPRRRLSLLEEKSRYEFHEYEDTADYRIFYQPFLAQLENCVFSQVRPERILDFGSGPRSVLAKILGEMGFHVECYDPFFSNNPKALESKYDLIVSTEVFEHFYNPREEVKNLCEILNPRGYLAAMTSYHRGLEHFHNWHYRRDPTHVSFYSEQTFQWMGRHFNLENKTNAHPTYIGRLVSRS